ncbi:MAG: TIGR03086 family metal-binding protein [Streptosporangiaceae bacterium]
MSDIADHYRRLATGFTEKVVAVTPDRWASPAPCEGWTARDVVRHMGDGAQMFLDRVNRRIPSTPSVDDDPVGAWFAVRDTVQAALDDPATATVEYDSPMGRMTFERGVDRFVGFDTLIHAWDLARAAGLDERLDPDEVHAAFEAAQPIDEMLRTPGVCGPKIEPPPGADEQTQLLNFLGRAV